MAMAHYTENSSRSAASRFGQMIGDAFERVVIDLIRDYVAEFHNKYEVLEPDGGISSRVTLEMFGGSKRQLDTVVIAKNSDDPVALLETKWLKDARHHNDKGAWILQLREVKKKYSTIRGAAAILAGYWTEGVAVVLMSEGGIDMVLVATDEQVYSTLQTPLNDFLGEDSFELDVRQMRQSYPRPWDLANLLQFLEEINELNAIAESWLEFEREINHSEQSKTGRDLIKEAIDKLLSPLPEDPQIEKFEISLQINTGNTIYREFDDVEAALGFIQEHFGDPTEILKRITPRKKPR